MSGGEDKTQDATPKRMRELRRDGSLQRSQDVSAWLGMGVAGATLVTESTLRYVDVTPWSSDHSGPRSHRSSPASATRTSARRRSDPAATALARGRRTAHAPRSSFGCRLVASAATSNLGTREPGR